MPLERIVNVRMTSHHITGIKVGRTDFERLTSAAQRLNVSKSKFVRVAVRQLLDYVESQPTTSEVDKMLALARHSPAPRRVRGKRTPNMEARL